jgi:hypothetical protein
MVGIFMAAIAHQNVYERCILREKEREGKRREGI